MFNKIHTVIVEDHQAFRACLKRMINTFKNFKVVGEAASVAEGLKLVRLLIPELVTVDISLPDGSGFDLTRAIKKILPRTRILIISIHTSSADINAGFQAGANGYLPKTANADDFRCGFETVAQGKLFRPPAPRYETS